MFDFLMWAGGIVITTAFASMGWLINMVFARLKEHGEAHDNLKARVEEHRFAAVQSFASRIDLDKISERILNKLDKIEEKLDRKADKE